MGVRVKDVGESEGRSVIGRIGIEGQPDIIPPEREQTSDGSLVAKEFGEPSSGGQANDGHGFGHDGCGLRL